MDEKPRHRLFVNVILTRGERDFEGNIRKAWDEVTPEDIEAGRRWYPDAQEYIRQQSARTGVPEHTVGATLAALSPRGEWKGSKTQLEKLLDTHGRGEAFPYKGITAYTDEEGKKHGVFDPFVKANAILWGGADSD